MNSSELVTWRILLVEDDEDDYLLTKDLLTEAEGVQVELEWTSVYDKAQSAIAERRHDLYLFDYRLGEQTGLDLLYFTLAQEIQTPVILLTGQPNHDIDVRAMKAGAVYYLVKNQLNPASLERSIRYALERKHNEDILRRTQEELEHRVAERTAQLAEKNQELEAFTYSVSHDLKAPLRAIEGYSQLLIEENGHQLTGEGRLFLQNIRNATEQMNQLITDLLDYSRMERRPLQAGILNLQRLVDVLLAERNIELQTRSVQVQLDCINVVADADGLAQALRNLIDNALKFTQNIPAPQIEIRSSYSSPQTCLLWIKDNGIGFDMKYHERIFEIFQRLHRTEDYSGTGIGLALVSKAVKRMQGRVWAESSLGAGATFFIELKAAPN